jgi:serine/threonine-protein kinase HipA
MSDPSSAPSAARVLNVTVNERLVGQLRESNDIWSFEYAPAWSEYPGAFSLSPGLLMAAKLITDGSSMRPVQWYFDNLLPEELLREVLAKEAAIDKADMFGLLQHFGAESAGSLVLLAPEGEPVPRGLKPLSREELHRRIKNLPQATLSKESPKRMSLAGAQHKMVVVLKGKELFEPLAGTPSTHILKPDSQSADYPHSVMNEFFTMRLANAVGVDVPAVQRLYAPAPAYIIQRFDRVSVPGVQGAAGEGAAGLQRLHIIDTCQLLNKSRSFKYQQATLQSLGEAVEQCRAKAIARVNLFRWVAFNVLVGNGDNHLKNISFKIDSEGVSLAQFYDLLSTAVYATASFANQAPTWPHVQLALSLGGANYFDQVTRDTLLEAGAALGLSMATATRVLEVLEKRLAEAADALIEDITQKFDELANESADPAAVRALQGGEMRLLRAICKIVIHDMLARIKRA